MAKVAYTAPVMLVSEVEAAVAAATGLKVATTTELTLIDEAITSAGLAASRWDGKDWWWLRGTGSFPTVADQVSYVLRTVNSNDMASLWAVQAVYYDDDWPLGVLAWDVYQQWYRLNRPTANTTKPLQYAVTGEAPSMYLRPIPDAAYTLYVDYTKRHSKITSTGSLDTALIVPGEFHMGVYVAGAIWLLQHNTSDPLRLRDCPLFAEAMGQMTGADPATLDSERELDKFPDTQGSVPPDKRIHRTAGGTTLLVNPQSI